MFALSVRCPRVLRSVSCLGQYSQASCHFRLYSTEKSTVGSPANKQEEKDDFFEPSRESRAEGPQFLNKPLGLPFPPHAGDNTGVDKRTLRQRRDDFVNHDKHLHRRQKLAKELFRPYFKDFNDMKYFKGKVFLAPERIFKAQFAGYFPNLHGRTLNGKDDDTTNVLEGNVSIVALSSSGWAENQVKSFCDQAQNPGLASFMDHTASPKQAQRLAQLVEINWEPNILKHWIIKLFMGRLKSLRDKSRWSRYFIVHKGFDHELRQAVGMANQKVGHVYLVDEQCRIRWAGHAMADPLEKESMVRAMGRLLAEPKTFSSAGTPNGLDSSKAGKPIKLPGAAVATKS